MDERTVWRPQGGLDTPYRRAQQEWDARMGGAIVQAANWRAATFAAIGVVGLSVLGLVYLGAQPKVVPHIVEIDHLGAAAYRGPVGRSGDYVPTDDVIRYHLHRFVEDTRSISSDPGVIRTQWLDAYTLVSPKGANMLTAFVTAPGNNPYARAQEQRVAVELLSAVRVTADTWQLDWRETASDKNGTPLGAPTVWRGMLRTQLQKPKTEEQLQKNPIGLYIDEIHWDKVQG